MLYDKTHPYEALIPPPGHSKRTHARSRSFQLHKLKPTHRRWLRNSVLVAAFVFILFLYSNHDSSHYRPNIPMYIVSKSDTDLNFGFADREPGNVERLGRTSPRNPPLKRKLGLVAIPAGEKAKPRVDELVRTFGMEHFSYFIFHWDNSTWDDLPWYRDVISARAIGQTKFWFAKRFLTPDVVQSYDYLWLWDDDIQLGSNFDAVGFTEILKSYNIHIAQPSLTIGQHGPQANVVTHRKVGIGRFTNFVEIMIPIFSSAAWACSWRLIPFDSRATWGVDNAWYPVCGSIGYCRFAVIDKYPVKHMDTKTCKFL
ncbi:hypothetical protein BKA69DRAFT_642040 [Paraphysoderma sedebokerense]|nr:hypothetical protein BKA69DRAFT_642040 [Paraphysoderma sedebokerense]